MDGRSAEDLQSPNTRQRVLGDFVIESEIGRGGMGVVWLATQRSLGRKVALKVLPGFATMDAEAVTRFRREAEATGRITHPGIVPVYAVGAVDGIHYFAMEYIDGPPLSAIVETLSLRQVEKLRASMVEEAQLADRYPALREPPATGAGNRYVRSCARLCADVANALAAAHRQRVVHRDLKPNNILIHPAGRPVVVDFGLARDEQATGLTRSGEQIGTPAYMAPEQARGHRSVDARVDVYGLGAVLYELLALRPPFEGSTAAEIAHRILTEEPVPLRRRNPNVPVDLAAIVHRCLAKSADERYPVIEAVELDLRSFLVGRPVTAELPSFLVRLQGALQRNRRSLTIAAGAALAATFAAVSAGIVDDRGDQAVGHRALDQAGVMLIERRDVDRARDLYERAEALTKDPELVRHRRRHDFRAAFDRFYPDKEGGGPQILDRFTAVFDEEDRTALRDLLDRLEGRGTLRFATRTLEMRTRHLEARQVTPEGLQAEWRPVLAGELLPTGEYLLRANSKDGIEAFVWADVRPDEDSPIAPRYVPADELPPDHAAVVDPADQRTIAIERCELTKQRFQQWLAGLPDPALVAELTPLLWEEDDAAPDAPVRGLSFHQARAFAAAHEAHLPTAREQWLAGSAGLQRLTHPWGSGFDGQRIAADPFRMSDPQPVRSLPAGRSPLGVFHVLGNVAEVLSAAGGGPPAIGGGSFLDDPRQLQLHGATGTVPTAALPDLRTGHPGAGLRLYRFVAPPDDPRAAELVAERREQLRQAEGGCVFHDWSLHRDGTLRCEVELNGRFDGADPSPLRFFPSPGFLQVPGSVRGLDGHRQKLSVAASTAPGGEGSWVPITLGDKLRPGQGYRFFIAATLQPAIGLLPVRDGYVLRLPMKRGYSTQAYTLTLPPDCRIEEVAPTPTIWTMDGRTRLMWEQTLGGQIETATVRLRVDGRFGDGIPVVAAAAERTRLFLRALSDPALTIDAWLDQDFLRMPGHADRDRTTGGRGAERFDLREVVDVVRIGSIETVELLVDWTIRDRDGSRFRLEKWPMWLQWRHQGDAIRAVRLQPHSRTDQGRYDGAAGYVHAGLQVRILPVPESLFARTQDELCELQVKLTRDDLTAQILGLWSAGEDLAAIRFRLTNCASVLRPGRMIGESVGEFGPVQDWLFEEGRRAHRERWYFVQRGTRHLLVRFGASQPTVQQASSVFATPQAAEWFEAVLGALQIDGRPLRG